MSIKAVESVFYPLVGTRRPNTIVLEGHSIVANNSSNTASWGSPGVSPVGQASTYSQGVFERAMIQSNYPFRVLANNAVGGNTSAQILARIPGDLALNPGYLYLDCLTNDALDSIPLATTIANVTEMLAMANAQNVAVIFALDGARTGLTQAQISLSCQACNYFKDYAFDHPNMLVFDQTGFRWDTTSYANSIAYTPLAGVTLDGVHPNAYGAGLAGTNGTLSLASLMKGLFGSGQFYPGPSANSDGSANGDTSNIIENPQMCGTSGTLGTGATGTVPNNMTVGRTSTGTTSIVSSIVTRASLASTFPGLYDDGTFGNVLKMAISGSSSLSFSDSCQLSLTPATTTLTSGSGPWEFEVEVAGTASSGTIAEFTAILFIYNSSGGYYVNLNTDVNGYGADPMGVTSFQGKLRSRPFYLPAGTGGGVTANIVTSPTSGGVMNAYVSNPKWRLLGA